MTLLDWVKDLFKRGVELFRDEEMYVDKNSKATVTRDLTKVKACSLGIISCDDAQDWYMICRREAPVGTIIEEYDASAWEPLFNELTVLVRSSLTNALVSQRNSKGAKILLEVLERRDHKRWAKDQKSIEVTAGKEDNKIQVVISDY